LKFLEAITNSKKIVASGGAVEGALNIYLMDLAYRHVQISHIYN